MPFRRKLAINVRLLVLEWVADISAAVRDLPSLGVAASSGAWPHTQATCHQPSSEALPTYSGSLSFIGTSAPEGT